MYADLTDDFLTTRYATHIPKLALESRDEYLHFDVCEYLVKESGGNAITRQKLTFVRRWQKIRFFASQFFLIQEFSSNFTDNDSLN